jgi:DNA-binding transcriptional regulator YiaG
MNYYKEVRIKSNLTQVEFAKKYGFKLSSLQHWEQGRKSTGYVKSLYKIIDGNLK